MEIKATQQIGLGLGPLSPLSHFKVVTKHLNFLPKIKLLEINVALFN